MASEPSDSWYRDGLRFRCTACGYCCTGAPGFVFVTREEITRIAAFLGRSDGWLPDRYLRKVGTRYSLTEHRGSGDCCFLEDHGTTRGCAIYPVRPLQCRTWPFWPRNLRSPEAWAAAADGCPGMNRGRHYAAALIDRICGARRSEDLPP